MPINCIEAAALRMFLQEYPFIIIQFYYKLNIIKPGKDMIILILIFAVLLPRAAIFLLWFFTNWFHGIFNTILWPLLGFIFLPVTLLWYTVVFHYFDNSWTAVPIVGLVIALLIDMSPGGRKYYRRRDY